MKIRDLPYILFKPKEFQRLTDDLGRRVPLDVDPRLGYHLDFTYLRIKVGLCDRGVIPTYRKTKFTDENGVIFFHDLKLRRGRSRSN
jgi:hypothetical protein